MSNLRLWYLVVIGIKVETYYIRYDVGTEAEEKFNALSTTMEHGLL
jgi:hypothetical protein